jgi:ligand-binding sensor domain-containing protein
LANELWIGTFEHGLDVMNIKTGKIVRHYSLGMDSNSLKSNFVVTILETSQKEVLIGTYSGLYKYNPQQDNFSLIKEVAPDAFVYSLFEDHSGTIWVGTIGDGVYYFDSRGQQHGKLDVRLLKKNQQLRNNVVSIFEDSSHAIWLATEGSGITRYNPVTKSVYNYSTENGLPSNFIYKIVQDKRNDLWISSSNGLVVLTK